MRYSSGSLRGYYLTISDCKDSISMNNILYWDSSRYRWFSKHYNLCMAASKTYSYYMVVWNSSSCKNSSTTFYKWRNIKI